MLYSIVKDVVLLEKTNEILEALTGELRRGTIVLAVLSSLREKKYGYLLSQEFMQKGMEVDQNTLYPLLRRLERQGLLQSDWIIEDSRPRRYYILSGKGAEVLESLKKEWEKLTGSLEIVLNEKKG